MVEDCGILNNGLFHWIASYHIHDQALFSFPGFAWPGLELLMAPSTCKPRFASVSGWGKRSVASDTPWWTGLNPAIKSTRIGWHVPWVCWRPLESYDPPVFGEEGQAAVCSSLGLSRTGYGVPTLTHSQLAEHSCWCQLALTFVQTWPEHALFFDYCAWGHSASFPSLASAARIALQVPPSSQRSPTSLLTSLLTKPSTLGYSFPP